MGSRGVDGSFVRRMWTSCLVRGGALAVLVAAAPPSAHAQEALLALEVRAGAVYSTPFAEGVAVVPGEVAAAIEPVQVGPRLAPFAELALVRRMSPSLSGEVRGGASFGTVQGVGAASTWDAGTVAVVHAVVGLRMDAAPGVDLRAGLGKALYLGDGVQVLQGGENTGILLSGGVVYDPPLPVPATAALEVQRHGFGSTPLRAAGAADGSMVRVLLSIGVSAWGRP